MLRPSGLKRAKHATNTATTELQRSSPDYLVVFSLSISMSL